jgi:hypothetical protein
LHNTYKRLKASPLNSDELAVTLTKRCTVAEKLPASGRSFSPTMMIGH